MEVVLRNSAFPVLSKLVLNVVQEVAARSESLRSQRSQSGDVDVRMTLREVTAVERRSLTR